MLLKESKSTLINIQLMLNFAFLKLILSNYYLQRLEKTVN